MKHYAGLDVSMEETSICVLDENGDIVREGSVPTEPDAISAFLEPFRLADPSARSYVQSKKLVNGEPKAEEPAMKLYGGIDLQMLDDAGKVIKTLTVAA